MKQIVFALAAAIAGIALKLAGLAVDAWLHAGDATLAREGVVTLDNPGHALVAAGVMLATTGLLAALCLAWGRAGANGVPGARWFRLAVVQIAGLSAMIAAAFALTANARHPRDSAEIAAQVPTPTAAPNAEAPAPSPAPHTHEALPAAATMGAVTHAPTPQAQEGHEADPASPSTAHEEGHVATAPAAASAEDASAPEGAAHSHVAPLPLAPDAAACASAYVEEVRGATERWQDFDTAAADGYYKSTPGRFVAHYANRAFIRDGVLADPSKPEVLMYVEIGGNRHLAGIMYLGLPGRAIPEVCGGSAAWHTHPEVCLTDAGMTVGFAVDGACPAGQRVILLPPMLHVWLVPNPDGPWDENMDPQALLAHFD